MSYKNTMKLVASNFNFVWKQLVYLVGCLLILAICSFTTIKPIIELLAQNNIGAEFSSAFAMFSSSPNAFALALRDACKDVILVIFNNFSEIYLSLIFAILLCVLLPFILVHISIYNLSSIAYQRTTMNMQVRYSQNALTTFKPGLKYALSNVVFTIPFTLIDLALIFAYIAMAKTFVSALAGLALLSALTIFVQSIKISLFAHYTGLVIAEGQNPFKAFGKSFVIVIKNFWKNLSTSIILHLTLIVVNSFILVFTFVAGLIVSIPATFVVMAFYYIVSYLNSVGQRYYLSDTIIYNPVKYEVKKDNFVTITVPEVSNEIEVETTSMKRNYKSKKNKKS